LLAKTAKLAADLSEADRRKDEFLAMLAHELRNPLAPISNAVQVLRFGRTDSETLRMASSMLERQVAHLARLVDDLLDISRITRGRIELRKERTELGPILDHALEATRALYRSMNRQLTVNVPRNAIYLDADPTRLAQVIGNLLNNACKFTNEGGEIALEVERDGGEAVVRVRDDGIGIAPDQLDGLFDMFTQVDTSLERTRDGLGLGLTLVKTLVEQHGGSVAAHSAGLGRGSEFVVRLPVVLEPPSPSPPVDGAAPRPIARLNILIVDDNEDGAKSLAMLLELRGHRAHTAHDGFEAIEAAERLRPDAVLLDIGLPKLNGFDVCRHIRQQAWGKDVVLIALTGWGQDEDRQRSTEAGFDAHLVKPVDHEALMGLLSVSSSLPAR
jgi:CheY-like chemotaxis protein